MRTDIVIGDIHGHFGELNTLINKLKPQRVHSTGDFGWWPHWEGSKFANPYSRKPRIWKQDCIKGATVYMCPGNHEDWWDLQKREDGEILVPNLIYKPRGSTFTLPDYRTILYMGGAQSIDQDQRMLGRDWFPEENISYADLSNLQEIKVDIVISHTLPKCFGDLFIETTKREDPNRYALDVVYEMYKPKIWYCGHFHKYFRGKFENTDWHVLAHDGRTNWWMWMN